MTKKDNRVVYNYHPINAFGNVWNFDGKGDPEKKELKIYRFFGSITDTHIGEAICGFMIDNDYEKIKIPAGLKRIFDQTFE